MRGEVDLATVEDLRERVADALRGPHPDVVIDLSAVTFMDAAGLRPLLEARAQLGDRLWLRDPSESVLMLLDLTDLGDGFVRWPTAAPEQVSLASPTRTRLGDPDQVDELTLQIAGLRQVMRRRAVVEQAKGVLMSIHHCTAGQAWQVLVKASADHHVRVGDLAAALAASTAGRSDCPPGTSTRAALDDVLPTPAPDASPVDPRVSVH